MQRRREKRREGENGFSETPRGGLAKTFTRHQSDWWARLGRVPSPSDTHTTHTQIGHTDSKADYVETGISAVTHTQKTMLRA